MRGIYERVWLVLIVMMYSSRSCCQNNDLKCIYESNEPVALQKVSSDRNSNSDYGALIVCYMSNIRRSFI